MTKVLFVNSGILGMASFSKFIREAQAGCVCHGSSGGRRRGTAAYWYAGQRRSGNHTCWRERSSGDVGNRAELVHSLRRLIASAALRRQVGTAGRRAIEGFGPDAYPSKLREVVQSIAPRSR